MRAHHVMTRNVITVDADASIRAAANLMLKQHISGLQSLMHNWPRSVEKR